MEAGGVIAGMLLFMVMPYLVVFGIGFGLMHAQRRNRAVDGSAEGE